MLTIFRGISMTKIEGDSQPVSKQFLLCPYAVCKLALCLLQAEFVLLLVKRDESFPSSDHLKEHRCRAFFARAEEEGALTVRDIAWHGRKACLHGCAIQHGSRRTAGGQAKDCPCHKRACHRILP